MDRTKYSIIVETLRKEILSGKWSLNSASFPSERALGKRFGVSRPTVSQALQELRGQGYLLRQQGKGTFLTRKAQKIGGSIGLIVPGVAYSEFFQPIVTALSGVCTANGYGLSIGSVFSANGDERARQATTLAHDLVEQSVVGVVFQPVESIPNAPNVNRQILSVFRTAGIPVVLLDSDIVPPPDRSEYDIVGVNNYDAGRRVAVHMIAAGAKRISFVSMPKPCYSIRHRFAGVQCTLASHGVLLKEMVELDAANVEEVRRFLRKEHPDGVICCCDTFAAFFKRTVEQLGKSVPKDLLLAGFDDVQHARIMTPALTTVTQPCGKIAREAFLALLGRIENPNRPPREILLTAPLVVRVSTRRVKSVKKGGQKTTKKRTGK